MVGFDLHEGRAISRRGVCAHSRRGRVHAQGDARRDAPQDRRLDARGRRLDDGDL